MADQWHIVSTHQTTELTPHGAFQDVLEVTGQSDVTGDHATIRVPVSQATPENVARLMADRMDALHAIHNL